MNSPLSFKSRNHIILLLAALLAFMLFFAARFLWVNTATENDPTIASHTPAESEANEKERDAGAAATTAEPADIPPDRTIKELVQTWNRGSAEEIASLFMSDGALIIPSGSQIQSREEIKKTLSEKRAGVFKETTLTNTIDEVTQPSPDTALVHGTYKLEGIKILGVSKSATGLYKLRQVKRDGRWFISKAELMGRDNG
jgi:uncharacterized protein (TIGR02246 family)